MGGGGGDMHGRGGVWQEECMVGGMHGRGEGAWQGACVAGHVGTSKRKYRLSLRRTV